MDDPLDYIHFADIVQHGAIRGNGNIEAPSPEVELSLIPHTRRQER